MDATQRGISLLLRSAVTGENLTLPEDFSLEQAVDVAGKHSIQALIFQGALNCGIPREDPVMQKLLAYYYKNLIRSERQLLAAESIFAAFEENRIPYMPVKGCNTKKLYPKPELRAMGDADILIHPEDHDRIRPIMESLGFRFIDENDHVFEWRSDALYVELHKSLVPPTNKDYYGYYGTGWQLAVKGPGYRHDLSVEDAYLFILTHFARHYRYSGIGCRHVTDLYVYRRKFADMDMKYINGELRRLHLQQFHENVLRMLEVWFADRESDPVTDLLTEVIFASGNWGTMENVVISQAVAKAQKAGTVEHSRLRAFLHAVFLPLDQMTYRYGFLRQYPFLLPVFWVVRWVQLLLFRRENIRRKLKLLRFVDDDCVRTHKDALQAVGLQYRFEDQE